MISLGVLETEAHDGFSLDGRVVDVDIGNVGKVDQRHDVAHAKHLHGRNEACFYR